MAQYSQATFNTFVKGLITESGEMTFPEGASVDELNCDLFKDGSRRRRLGIELESGATGNSRTVGSSTVLSTGIWKNVDQEADTTYLIVQVGKYMHMYNLGGSSAVSNSAVETFTGSGVEFELDLTLFERSTGSGASTAPIQVTSIKGALVVASKEIDTFYLVKEDDGSFTATEIEFRVRDFEWQSDIDDLESSTSSASAARQYDTENAGWVGTKGTAARSAFGSWPPLTLPWYAGKDSNGDFDASEWRKIHAGNTLIANGHYIFDLYDINRASKVSGAGRVIESGRFTTVEGHASRVFYSGMEDSVNDNGNKVFFSQLLESGFAKIGRCYQANDPTGEQLSDLLDTDGGFIVIPEAYGIKKLHSFGPDLYVFAANGVWRISGVDDVFRATEYSVSKIGEDGIISADSFVSASGQPYWWSPTGIYTLGTSEEGGVVAQNISVRTIQTFFDEIGPSQRGKVKAAYDEAKRRVLWMYPSTNETNDNKRNRFLWYDEVLEAFFPWEVADQTSDTDYVVDAIFNEGVGATDITYNVVDTSGNQVVDSSGNNIVVTRTGQNLSSSQLKFLVVDGSTDRYTFADNTATDFNDWGDADFTSYAEAGYNFLGDGQTRKTTPYITTYMKTTATGFTASGSGYVEVRPSSCILKVYWDFKTEPSFSGQECYKQKYTPAVDISDLGSYNYPVTLEQTRVKCRGRGRVMKIRFESTSGYDFHLIGYDVISAAAGRF